LLLGNVAGIKFFFFDFMKYPPKYSVTAGVVLVITGMILFYLRKGTEKAIKNG